MGATVGDGQTRSATEAPGSGPFRDGQRRSETALNRLLIRRFWVRLPGAHHKIPAQSGQLAISASARRYRPCSILSILSMLPLSRSWSRRCLVVEPGERRTNSAHPSPPVPGCTPPETEESLSNQVYGLPSTFSVVQGRVTGPGQATKTKRTDRHNRLLKTDKYRRAICCPEPVPLPSIHRPIEDRCEPTS